MNIRRGYIMNEFDRNILIVNENICKNIASVTEEEIRYNKLRKLKEAKK